MAEQAVLEITETWDHDTAGFVCVNDAGASAPEVREPVPVYVPMLVYLVQRLGGIENINDLLDEFDEYSGGSRLFVKGTDRSIVSVTVTGRVPSEGFLELIVEDWCNSVPLLSVRFWVPEKWHLGDWFVAEVSDQDRLAPTRSLRREIAMICNDFMGMSLADCSRGTYVR